MDGVDRHDQYRALFSLCKTRGFKKYPVKLVLALLDIALTNAVLHYKLRWKDSDCPNSKMSRADFLQDIGNKLISSNREWEQEEDPGILAILGSSNGFSPESNSSVSRLLQRNVPNNIDVELCTASRGCVYEALEKYTNILNKNSKKCQVCEYERRGTGRYKNVMVCLNHGIRACGYARPSRALEGNNHLITNTKTNQIVSDFSWICGDGSGLTCMEKFHLFYLPRNLFKPTPGISRPPTEKQQVQQKIKFHFARIITSSELYRARQATLGIDMKGRPKKKNTKSKRNVNDNNSNEDTSDDGSQSSPPPRRSPRTKNNKRKKIIKKKTGKSNNNEDVSDDGSASSPPPRRSPRTNNNKGKDTIKKTAQKNNNKDNNESSDGGNNSEGPRRSKATKRSNKRKLIASDDENEEGNPDEDEEGHNALLGNHCQIYFSDDEGSSVWSPYNTEGV